MKTKLSLLVISLFVISLSLIGCGGGGGGGNPIAPMPTVATANLSGNVTMNGVPMPNTAVYLYKSEAAKNAGIAKLTSLRGSIVAQTISANGSYPTTTDKNGYYKFTNIPVGRYTLIAVKDENHQFAQPNIMLASNQTVDAQLTPTGSVTGHVVMSGQPIGGATAYLEGTSYVAITNSDGVFAISHVPASQTFSLKVSSAKAELSTPISVEIAPAENKELPEINLTSLTSNLFTITGNMKWANPSITESFDGLMVAIRNNQTTALNFAMPDGSGKYKFIVTSVGSYTVGIVDSPFLDADTSSTPEIQNVLITENTKTYSLATFSISLSNQRRNLFDVYGSVNKSPRLLDEADNSGVPVQITEVNNNGPQFTTITDSNGGFNFDVASGDYRIKIGGRYTAPAIIKSIATDTPLGVITIKPAVNTAPTFILTGVVNKEIKLSGENDNSGVIVSIQPVSAIGNQLTTVTRADGSFIFAVASGSYNISISGNYVVSNSSPLNNPYTITNLSNSNIGTINVVPNVGQGGRVKWSVITPNIATVSYKVYLSDISEMEKRTKYTSLGTGEVIFENVNPGTYTLSIKSADNGYSATSAQFHVAAGEEVTALSTTAILQAPTINSESITYPALEIEGTRFSYPIAYLNDSRLPNYNTSSWTSVHAEYSMADTRPGTYSLRLKNSDGTKSTNVVPYFIPVAKPKNINIKATTSSITADWVLADFADKSKVELYDSSSNLIGSWTLQTTHFVRKSLPANTSYSIKVYDGVGSLWSAPVSLTITTKQDESNASILPSVTLANSSSIDGGSRKAFGFESMGNNYYIGWHNTDSTGEVGIYKYNMTTGTLIASITINSDYSESIDAFSLTSNGTDLYVFYYDSSSGYCMIRRYDQNLVDQGSPITFDGSGAFPADVSRGKIKTYGNKLVFTGDNGGSTYNEYAILMDYDLSSPHGVYIDTSGNTLPHPLGSFCVMSCADIANNKLFIAVAEGVGSTTNDISIHKYNLTTAASIPGQLINIPAKAPIREFIKTGNSLLLGVDQGGENQEYWKFNILNGYYSYLPSVWKSSATVDNQGEIWFQNRMEATGPMYFIRTSDGNNVDRSILVNSFANITDSAPNLGNPDEFIKMNKSDNSINLLYRNSNSDFAVLHNP